MKTLLGTLQKDGTLINSFSVDLSKVPSDDPIAFVFGQLQAKSGHKLPKKRTKEYRELAPAYIQGFKTPITQ